MLIGLIGLPSSGKSTFFKAATLAEVEIANYPFTTIKPNSAVAYVKVKDPAKEFNKTSNPRDGYVLKDSRFIPFQLMDVAGLVENASEGKGLGLQFLNDLSQADALIHVVDCSGSTNEAGEPVPPLTHDPVKNIKVLEKEIDLWFYSILEKTWDRFAKKVQVDKLDVAKAIHKQFSGIKITEDMVNKTIKKLNLNRETPHSWSKEELKSLCIELRKTSKPIIIAANKIDISGSEKNLENLQKTFPEYTIIPCSADSEIALKEAAKHDLIKYIPGSSNFEIKGSLNDAQTKALEIIKKNVLEKYSSTGVQNILDTTVFNILKYIAIYPGGVGKLEDSDGNVIPDCFLMKEGSTALDFAYRLHTDFGKNFIRAVDVKTKKTIGKDYILNNGDIIQIISGK
jgi:ribosome-binding ATPase